jgi:CDP-6-deoxy-D-xylo-4-hexulose-3-dehydrase
MTSKNLSWLKSIKKLTGVRQPVDTAEMLKIRGQFRDLSEQFMQLRGSAAPRIGTDPIPASSKFLDAHDLTALVDSSLDLWLTEGRYSDSFASGLKQAIGVEHLALTVSGSSANLLAFTALTSPRLGNRSIQAGSEVITVAAGFPTTIFPIIQNRCIPVFVDIDPRTLNINVDYLEAARSPKTRAVMIAHTLGNPFNLSAVKSFCDRYGYYLIEDCCDALGATYNGKHVGTYGDVGTLSFYPAHHITTGEGGALFTKSAELISIIESYRDWGRDCFCKTGMNNSCGKRFAWKLGDLPEGYDHKFIYTHLGYNMKMTDMQAALGFSQLKKLDFFVRKRRENYDYMKSLILDSRLSEVLDVIDPTENSSPSWFGFMMCLKNVKPNTRLELTSFLEKNKVITRLLFAGNIVRQPVMADQNYRVASDLDVTDNVMNHGFWTGIWPGLEKDHLEYIVSLMKSYFRYS